MRERARGSFLVPTLSHLEDKTFPCASKRTNLLRTNITDLGFGEELSLLPHGKVSKCFAIAIYVKK